MRSWITEWGNIFEVVEEQGGFRSGRGCIDQMFVLK